jgi:hypothetical protein
MNQLAQIVSASPAHSRFLSSQRILRSRAMLVFNLAFTMPQE